MVKISKIWSIYFKICENFTLSLHFYTASTCICSHRSWRASVLIGAGFVLFISTVTDGSIAVAGFPDLQIDVTDLVFPPEVISTDPHILWSHMTTALITESVTPVAAEFYLLTGTLLQRSDDFLQGLDVKMDML